jgi:glycerol-3-phosphate acyltransferase PlsY
MMTSKIIFVVVSYLIGAVPFGLLIGKLSGVDVRTGGSGNIGATNVGRLLGRKMGFLTLFFDIAKAILPMVVADHFLCGTENRDLWVALCGAAAFTGHLYPVYLGFRGGKGVASALGIFLYLAPVAALVDGLIFIAVVWRWGYVSLGSLTASLMLPGLIWLLYRSALHAALAFAVGGLIWMKHRENIGRLKRHEEKSWKKGS